MGKAGESLYDAIPLFGLSLLVLCFSIRGFFNFLEYHEVGSWKTVPALIKDTEINTLYKKGNSKPSRLLATYTYIFNKETFVGSRVFQKDDLHVPLRFIQDYYRTLLDHKNKKTFINVFVNPHDPRQSTIFRILDGELVFLPLAGFLGFLLFFLLGIDLLLEFRKIKFRERNLKFYPNQPWLAEENWNGFKIRAKGTNELFDSWFFSFFAFSFATVITLGIWVEKDYYPLDYLELLVFAGGWLFVIGNIFRSLYLTLRFVKFRTPFLFLFQLPIEAGKMFEGIVFLKGSRLRKPKVELSVTCMKFDWKIAKRKRLVTKQTEMFHFRKEFEIINKRNCLIIPFKIPIPEDIPGYWKGTSPSYIWKLWLIFDEPGINYYPEFDLPVYELSDSQFITFSPFSLDLMNA